jgi:hypothetical protein
MGANQTRSRVSMVASLTNGVHLRADTTIPGRWTTLLSKGAPPYGRGFPLRLWLASIGYSSSSVLDADFACRFNGL